MDRTHAKLATGLRVNVTLLEKMGKDLAEMKEAVKALTGTSAVLKAQKLEHMFPLKTTAEVDRYLKDDPEAALAMERYTLILLNIPLHVPPTTFSLKYAGLVKWTSARSHTHDRCCCPYSTKASLP